MVIAVSREALGDDNDGIKMIIKVGWPGDLTKSESEAAARWREITSNCRGRPLMPKS